MMSLLFLVSLLSFALAGDVSRPRGCNGTALYNGFDLNYYKIPYNDPDRVLYHTPFIQRLYDQYGYVHTIEGVTDIRMNGNEWSSTPLAGNLKISPNNFTMLATGYFKAPVTGRYTLIMNSNDDLGTLQFGLRDGASCCSDDFDNMVDDTMLMSRWSDAETPSRVVYLTAGVYYPMRYFFFQTYNVYRTDLQIQPPKGANIITWENVFQLSNQTECKVVPN